MGNQRRTVMSEQEKAAYELAYVFWRFEMYYDGYGSYNGIEWAVSKRLLTPLKHPHRLWGWVVKKIIRRHEEHDSEDWREWA
jgi:hypothetical protein